MVDYVHCVHGAVIGYIIYLAVVLHLLEGSGQNDREVEDIEDLYHYKMMGREDGKNHDRDHE